MLPLVPGIGRSVGGARIWVSIGPISFQPGEFAKICLALFFAGYLDERRELIAAGTWQVGPLRPPRAAPPPADRSPRGASRVVVMVGQKDLGSSLLFFALFVVMLWVATERGDLPGHRRRSCSPPARYVAVAAVRSRAGPRRHLARPVEPLRGQGLSDRAGHVRDRRRRPRRHRPRPGRPEPIPPSQNDFIFAAIGEELGLFGATAVLMAFVLMIGAGLRIAIRAERPFEKLLATGLTTMLGVQAFIIIGGVIRVVPLTGVTLPFVSYGGSSLVANYVLLALLMRISDTTARTTRRAARRADARRTTRAGSATRSRAPRDGSDDVDR